MNQACSQGTCERALFTPEMKATHTLLIPTMLPVHFKLIIKVLEQEGYHAKLLTNSGHSVVDQGLETVHNDTCYPALLVIGQMLDALESGEYDPHKIAFMITQTGGGCRASNYIFLLRKALAKRGYGYIPVVSVNFSSLEKNPGFSLSPSALMKIVYAMMAGDLLMNLSNQCRPYEQHPGSADRLVDYWTEELEQELRHSIVTVYGRIRRRYPQLIQSFAQLPRRAEKKIPVGIVGEIYVKYSPLGNNNLEQFLLSEGAEPVVPGLLDFCLYCVYNGIEDHKLYGGKFLYSTGCRFILAYLLKKQRDIIKAIRAQGSFKPPAYFKTTCERVQPYLDRGVKMGEGWLLTAEMVELIDSGVKNIVCTQPFGCLPNHIVGKGMIRVIKERHPEANIVAVDYDPGASQVNQQNRIKLMLANAQAESGTAVAEAAVTSKASMESTAHPVPAPVR